MATLEKDLVVSGSSSSSVQQAAAEAAERYSSDQVDEHARMIGEAWAAKLQEFTNRYTKAAMGRTTNNGRAEAEAEAITVVKGKPLYPWWNIILAGPFQPDLQTGGPYLPHKIFQAKEKAFMLGALWMNPAGIGWNATNPSAANIMNAFSLQINFETVDLSNVANGPDPAAINMNPIADWSTGIGNWLKVFKIQIGDNFFPEPPEGKPTLYEMNVLADVTAAGAQPFAGYSTWVLDPDTEPPFLMPEVNAQWQYDLPARFLVYKA